MEENKRTTLNESRETETQGQKNTHRKNPSSSLPGHKCTTDFLDLSYFRHTSKKFQFLWRIMQATCANYREPVDNSHLLYGNTCIKELRKHKLNQNIATSSIQFKTNNSTFGYFGRQYYDCTSSYQMHDKNLVLGSIPNFFHF